MVVFSLILIAVAVVLVVLQMRWTALLEYLFLVRVPLMLALLLLGFPVLSQIAVPELLANIMVLSSGLELWWVSLSAILAGGMVIQTAGAIFNLAPYRFNLPKVAFWHDRIWRFAPLLALPVLVTSWRLSGEIGTSTKIGAMSAALLVATLIGLATRWFKVYLTGRDLESFEQKIHLTSMDGYSDSGDRGVAADHLRLTANLLMLIVLYGIGAMLLGPVKNTAPALSYLLFIMILLGFLFSGATFFFDRYRVPFVLLSVVSSFVLYTLEGVDHYYRLKPIAQASASIESPMLAAAGQRLAGSPIMVVVAASGGGIQAAGWTARVMTGLQTELGDPFTRSICVVSSVSGGSVGALYCLDGMGEHGWIDPDQIDAIPERAMENSLPASAWGMAYPDFIRAIGLGYFVPKLLDRGAALEDSFQARLRFADTTVMGRWRQGAIAGRLPIPMLNSTIVETGGRFVMTPFRLHPQVEAHCLADLYPGFDMNASTAARMSATFPYVTPIARPNQSGEDPAFHLADGGYFDNFGAFSILEWLKLEVLAGNPLGLEKILFVQINAFPSTPASKATMSGWDAAWLGPVVALANVRTSTQQARTHLEQKLMAKVAAQEDIAFEVFDFRFSLDPEDHGLVDNEYQDLEQRARRSRADLNWEHYDPPLSWKLDRYEKDAIYLAWEMAVKGDTMASLRKAYQIQNNGQVDEAPAE